MPTTLRGARVAAVLTAVASLLGAGPVRSLTGQHGPETDSATTALPAVADPETAQGEELAASLRAFDDAVITLAEEATAADAARATAVADLEAASEAHEALLDDVDDAGGSLPAAPTDATRTTDMFRTLHVRTPATTPLGGALSDGGGESDEIAAAARAEAEAEAAADQVAAEAEAAAAALAEAEAEESDV
ncbi:MAG TPA: hypothetical protein VFY82_15355, partial [Acidimicrobiales bacterium]|nr:hypothetical protein [Acidimicrobiales bacterium]